MLKNSFFVARISSIRAIKQMFFVFLAYKYYIIALISAFFLQLGFSKLFVVRIKSLSKWKI